MTSINRTPLTITRKNVKVDAENLSEQVPTDSKGNFTIYVLQHTDKAAGDRVVLRLAAAKGAGVKIEDEGTGKARAQKIGDEFSATDATGRYIGDFKVVGTVRKTKTEGVAPTRRTPLYTY